eukprot:1339840-Amphidinium_carterae.1
MTALKDLQRAGQLRAYKAIDSPTLGTGFTAGFSSVFQAHAVKQWLEVDQDLDVIVLPLAVFHE